MEKLKREDFVEWIFLWRMRENCASVTKRQEERKGWVIDPFSSNKNKNRQIIACFPPLEGKKERQIKVLILQILTILKEKKNLCCFFFEKKAFDLFVEFEVRVWDTYLPRHKQLANCLLSTASIISLPLPQIEWMPLFVSL